MRRVAFVILICAAFAPMGACSNPDDLMAPNASARQPRFENGGMAGSGGYMAPTPGVGLGPGGAVDTTSTTTSAVVPGGTLGNGFDKDSPSGGRGGLGLGSGH